MKKILVLLSLLVFAGVYIAPAVTLPKDVAVKVVAVDKDKKVKTGKVATKQACCDDKAGKCCGVKMSSCCGASTKSCCTGTGECSGACKETCKGSCDQACKDACKEACAGKCDPTKCAGKK